LKCYQERVHEKTVTKFLEYEKWKQQVVNDSDMRQQQEAAASRANITWKIMARNSFSTKHNQKWWTTFQPITIRPFSQTPNRDLVNEMQDTGTPCKVLHTAIDANW